MERLTTTPMKRSPARLVIALSVAAALAVFILYTSIAGAGTPQIQPSDLVQHPGNVLLVGTVVGQVRGDSHNGGMRFTLKDDHGKSGARTLSRGSRIVKVEPWPGALSSVISPPIIWQKRRLIVSPSPVPP